MSTRSWNSANGVTPFFKYYVQSRRRRVVQIHYLLSKHVVHKYRPTNYQYYYSFAYFFSRCIDGRENAFQCRRRSRRTFADRIRIQLYVVCARFRLPRGSIQSKADYGFWGVLVVIDDNGRFIHGGKSPKVIFERYYVDRRHSLVFSGEWNAFRWKKIHLYR